MNILFLIFTLLIILAPLPFGMVHSLSQALFATLFLSVIIGYSLIQIRQGQPPVVSLRRIAPETIGFFLVMVWAVLQMSSWVPAAWHHPLWAEAGAVLGQELKGSITVARGAALESLMRLTLYGIVFWLALQWGRDRLKARFIVGTVFVAGVLYALYGLILFFSGHEAILGVEIAGSARNVSGTFVNRNNFATLIGLGLVAGTGLYLAGLSRTLSAERSGRNRRLHILQQAFVISAPQLAGMLILLTALFLSNSRAGVVCTLVALLLLICLGPLRRKTQERRYQLLGVSLLGIILAVFLLSGDTWLQRLTATELEREGRLIRYEQTWQAIQQAPWTGYGLGAFEQTFLLFADENTSNTDKAHNDWLEMIFELGFPAAIIWFMVLAGLALRCLFGFFERQRDAVYPLVGFCGAALVGLHALVDFSLQIPAVAITFAVLLGVGVAQSWSSLD